MTGQPTIVGIRHTHVTSNQLTCSVLLPNGSNTPGNLVLIIGNKDGTGAFSDGLFGAAEGTGFPPAGWAMVGIPPSSAAGAYLTRVLDGTEGFDGTDDAVVLQADQIEEWAFTALTVSNWYGSVGGGFDIAIAGTVNDANPDPPSLTVPWDGADTLWGVWMGTDRGDMTVSVFPSGYTDNQHQDNTGGLAGVTHAFATRELTGTDTQNPSAFTMSIAEEWAAATFAIRPASAVPDVPESGWGVLLN